MERYIYVQNICVRRNTVNIQFSPTLFYLFLVTFIGLQLLGSMSFLFGNQQTSHQSPLSSSLRDNKNVKDKEQNVENHVNLKNLKQEQLNRHGDDKGNY